MRQTEADAPAIPDDTPDIPDSGVSRIGAVRRARVQMILQAVCYAAYANELLGLDISGEEVLTVWRVACERKGEA